MSGSVVPHAESATEINRRHQFAKEMAEAAVEHAIECGKLLLQVKRELPHGEFRVWIERNCEFKPSTATRYMTAAKQNATGVAFSSLRSLFPSGERSNNASLKLLARREAYQTAVRSGVAPLDAEIVAVQAPAAGPAQAAPAAPPESDQASPDYVEWSPEDEAEHHEQMAREEAEAIASFIGEDDQRAALVEQLKQQARLIAGLRAECGHYMTVSGNLTRSFQDERKTTLRQSRLIDKLKAEIEKLQAERETLQRALEALDAEVEQLRAQLAGGAA